MARTQRKRRNVDTWKKKNMYEILAPKAFGEKKIGETMSVEPDSLKGRVIKSTMTDITGDISKQHIKIEFRLGNAEGNKIHTEFIGQSLSRDYMRSQIRRKSTRVECVIDAKTRDDHIVRVKSIAMAIGRAQAAQRRAIRKIMKNLVIQRASDMTLEQFITEVLKGRLSAEMYRNSGKIYSLKRVEIRKIRVLTPKKRHIKG